MANAQGNIALEEEDLRSALREMKTYVDITEGDLKRIYEIALEHARQRIAAKVPVEDIMTKIVVSVKQDDDIQEAVRLLSDHRISGMPVVDGDKHVVGIISEADLLPLAGMKKEHTFKDILHNILGQPLPPVAGGRVESFMNAPALTIGPEEDISNAAEVLDARRFKRLPVVDEGGKLIGIISRADIVRMIRAKV